MSPNDIRRTASDNTHNASTSPARETQRDSLDVLTLGKKRSWFGSLRDAVQHGALRAKAAVDSFRGDQHKQEQQKAPEPNDNVEPEAKSDSQTRQSTDSTMSTTRSKAFPERRHTLGSKNAVVSLRQHLPLHPTKHHHKRSSVYSVATRPSSDMSNAAADRFGSLQQLDDASATHKRKGSVADSLVESIRGLSRRNGRPSSPEKQTPTRISAETVPLPTSPMDIPSTAPALELDLGPAEFMSTTFTGSPAQKAEDMKLRDPANFNTARPRPRYIHIPDEIKAAHATVDRTATPSNLLRLPYTPVDESRSECSAAPVTPMPGTTFTLEVDGANSETSDKSQVFERSVTPATGKERKQLRAMRSLDAMAEACSIAHAYDEKLQETDKLSTIDQDDGTPPSVSESIEAQFYTPRRHNMSDSTAHTCPTDMQEIARQATVQPGVMRTTKDDVKMQGWTIEDLFAPTTVDGVGPPSPVRSVVLPFRPKASRPGKSDDTKTSGRVEQAVGALEEGGTTSPSEWTTPEQSLEAQLHLQRNHAVAQDLSTLKRMPRRPEPSEETDSTEHLTSEDDMQARAQALLTPDIILPAYDDIESPTLDGLSPHGGPLVPVLYRGITTSDSPSPGTARSRTTYTAGLGDAEYKFTLDNWLKSSSSPMPPEEDPATPQRRFKDCSIDSISTNEERQTPQISPQSTNPDQTPSMGSRLKFDLKRSERNMRYNALHQEVSNDNNQKHALVQRPQIRFMVGASEDSEASVLQLADFASAYSGSRESSPQKTQKLSQVRVGSEDSVADSLKVAASNYNRLEQCLEGIGGDAEALLESVETLGVLSPTTSAEEDEGVKCDDRNLRSAAPSAEEQADAPTAASGALSPENFLPVSPMTSRARDTPSIRFRGVHIEQTKFSPQEVDHGQENKLPEVRGEPSLAQNGYPDMKQSASPDTLDKTLHLYSSPDSGYQGDQSSVSPIKAKGPPASRYRSLTRRSGATKPLGDVQKNSV